MHGYVGLTHDPEHSQREWEGKVRGFDSWVILARGLRYEHARSYAKKMAETYGCTAGRGGPRMSGDLYSVYKFRYTSRR